MIPLSYLLWFAACVLIFAVVPRRFAPWICLFGGWIWLPPALYPAQVEDGFPFWIIGGSLPSDILLSKAWVAPAATIAASALFDWKRWRDLTLSKWDALVAAFCVWPALQGLIVSDAAPQGWISGLYLAGAWGVPWMLGRAYLRDDEEMKALASALVVTTLTLLPIAIIEGISELRVHTLIFGEHPYASNGINRYIGYRPQAFFENGNQYGIWVAIAALAGFWARRNDTRYTAAAAVLGVMALASQSAGAILLMGAGVVALAWQNSFRVAYRYGIWALGAAGVLGVLLIAGLLPIRSFVENTAAGQAMLDAIRATGRGSFAWRISQDLKAASLLREHLLIGHGMWDWFMAMRSRPWGFPLLVIGQFGLIGLSLILLPMMRAVVCSVREAARGSDTAKLVAVVLIASALDAALNSFLFWPFIVIAAFYGSAFIADRTRDASPEAQPA